MAPGGLVICQAGFLPGANLWCGCGRKERASKTPDRSRLYCNTSETPPKRGSACDAAAVWSVGLGAVAFKP